MSDLNIECAAHLIEQTCNFSRITRKVRTLNFPDLGIIGATTVPFRLGIISDSQCDISVGASCTFTSIHFNIKADQARMY